MNEKSGSIQNQRLVNTDISTCITRCEKRIYFTNSLKQKMGNDLELINNGHMKNNNFRGLLSSITKGGL